MFCMPNWFLLKACYAPGAFLGAENVGVTKNIKNCCPQGTNILVDKDFKQNIYYIIS